MTTIAQTCVETQFLETATVKLKVASQKSSESSNHSAENNNYSKAKHLDINSGGWTFLQALSNVSSNPRIEKQNAYVHPLSKQYYSSPRLSQKSLELCTESLGSETGSDILDSNILSLSSRSSNSTKNEKLESSSSSSSTSSKKEENPGYSQLEYYCCYSSPKNNNNNNSNNKAINLNHSSSKKFPPPLTTRSGNSPLQFRPRREYGRLVLEAVEAPLKQNHFHAERSEGRLRLTFVEDDATMFDSKVISKKSGIIEEHEVDVEEEVVDSEDEECEESVDQDNDFSGVDHHDKIDDRENFDDDDDDDDDANKVAYKSEDMNENRFEIEVEMGMEKYQRLIGGRCKEGGHGNEGLCNWEPLWVASS